MRSPRRNCASIAACTSASPDHLLAGVGGELVGFPQQIEKGPHARRQLVGIAGEPCRLLDDARDAAAVERPQLLAPCHRADQPRIEQRRLRRALDPVLEIGGDLEQIGKLLVIGAEQVVERRRTDQDHLDLERYRLRRERHRARHAEQLLQSLDPDLAGFERPLQRGPAEIAGQAASARRARDSRHWRGAARPASAG